MNISNADMVNACNKPSFRKLAAEMERSRHERHQNNVRLIGGDKALKWISSLSPEEADIAYDYLMSGKITADDIPE